MTKVNASQESVKVQNCLISKGLGPDQDGHSVDPNCLQSLSANNKSCC